MDKESTATVSGPKRKRRRFWYTSLVLLIGTTVALTVFRWRVDSALATLEAEIRAKGEPVTLAELDAFYPQVPDEENGALVYLRAAEILETFGDGNGYDAVGSGLKGKLEGARYSHETLAQARAYLATRQSVFDVLAEAVAIATARYPVDLSTPPGQGSDAELFGGIQGLQVLLWVQGFVALQDRNWETFSLNQRALFHLADSFGTIPTWRQNHRLLLWRAARDLMKRAITSEEFPPSLYESLDTLYADIGLADVVHRRLFGERVYYEYRLEAYYGGGAMAQRYGVSLPLRARLLRHQWIPGVRSLAKLETYRGIRFMTTMLADRGKPWSALYRNAVERQPYIHVWENNGADDPSILENGDHRLKRVVYQPDGTTVLQPITFRDLVTLLLHPEMRSMSDSSSVLSGQFYDITTYLVHDEIESRSLRLAMLVDTFRQQMGTLPDSLDGLDSEAVAAIEGDPFGGGPLRYKVVEGGFIIYSIGDDLVDNGGQRAADGSYDFVVPFLQDTREIPEKDPPPGPSRGRVRP